MHLSWLGVVFIKSYDLPDDDWVLGLAGQPEGNPECLGLFICPL